jgi:uncharacterized membrane protein YkvA (DUF1232 family)
MGLLNEAEKQKNEKGFDENESLKKEARKISETLVYKTFVMMANRIIQKPLSIFRLIKQVLAHLKKYDSVKEFTKDAKEQLSVLIRLLKAYADGRYRDISMNGLVGTIAALIYFVSPLDFIPDFLLFGLVDDVAILLWVYNNYRKEIEAFLDWEDRNKTKIQLEEKRV